jgi:membrane associated rhomboid family serine protease
VPLIVFWEVIELPAVMLLGFWFVLQLFNAGAIAATASTGGGVAFAAHAAGFVSGIAGVYALRPPRRPEHYWA